MVPSLGGDDLGAELGAGDLHHVGLPTPGRRRSLPCWAPGPGAGIGLLGLGTTLLGFLDLLTDARQTLGSASPPMIGDLAPTTA